MPPVDLTGCTSEPLMNYLKALGILRLVTEQSDPQARAFWRNESFVLQSRLDSIGLEQFFLEDYKPTPIVGPWAGGSGFFPGDKKAKAAVQALKSSSSNRCDQYREVIQCVSAILAAEGISTKPTEEEKTRLLRRYRSELPDNAIRWIDAAWVLQRNERKAAPLLGTGGNDGRLDFSRNFMERLVELGLHDSSSCPMSACWLKNALFRAPVRHLVQAASGQFSPGRVGGPNATQGMEGSSASNPWDFVMMIEGTLLFGGAAARRLGVGGEGRVAFPFTVRATAAGAPAESANDSASSRGDLWLPLWSKPARLCELQTLFSEGRAEVGGRPARDSVDFARAAASLGVDRGIDQFARVSFLKRSGKSFLATPLGHVSVRRRESIDLLRELDPWLDRFRNACQQKDVSPRFTRALRSIEETIFDYCRYGGPVFFQRILVALGHAERALVLSKGVIGNRTILPIGGLSVAWVTASKDDSAEFEIALALAGIHDLGKTIGPLRYNLEPVNVRRAAGETLATGWAERDRSTVWNSADCSRNFSAVLHRRLMDAAKGHSQSLPLAAVNSVSLPTVSRFLVREVDDHRIEDLLWGLILLPSARERTTLHNTDSLPLPRSYALLKLLFLPHPLRKNDQEIVIQPEPSILPLLMASHVGEACRLAMRRLRASGLLPLPHARSGAGVRDADWQELDFAGSDGQRLAASLLLPISSASVEQLRKFVTREALGKECVG